MSPLHRRYGRLMLAYPRAYRRTHGAEILTTLMDAAGPDRSRPTATEARDLLLGGLRQRFRLPVGRLIVVAAVLAALTVGALGAGAGSALGWTAAQRPPTDAAIAEIAGLALGEPVRPDVSRQPEEHGLTYQILIGTARQGAGSWSAEQATDRLRAAGWTVRPARLMPAEISYSDAGGVTRWTGESVDLVAQRDGLVLDVSVTQSPGRGNNAILSIEPAEPAPVLPLTILGAVAGLIAGWLLTARVGYRLRRAEPWQRFSIAGVALVAGLLLAPLTLRSWFITGWAVTAVTGSGPHGLGGRPLLGAYTAYVDSAVPVLLAAGGLLLAAVAVVLALLTRPAAGPAEPEAAA
ncbi:hypothetical protein AB0M46_17480 [Dactylosporangium sp. NPDC051485]|uniref:hypothetical protein n=1 Tax=Dactylosporangium sp. NPDC051485 TaxID=3154846 RepID=UPI003449DA30